MPSRDPSDSSVNKSLASTCSSHLREQCFTFLARACARARSTSFVVVFQFSFQSDSRSAQQGLITKVRERFLLVFPDCQDVSFPYKRFYFIFLCARAWVWEWKFWGKKELACVCGLRQMPFTCCFSRLQEKPLTKKPPCRCCFLVSVRLICCLKAGSHVRHSISTRKSTCDPRRRKHKRSCACLVPVTRTFSCAYCIVRVNQP